MADAKVGQLQRGLRDDLEGLFVAGAEVEPVVGKVHAAFFLAGQHVQEPGELVGRQTDDQAMSLVLRLPLYLSYPDVRRRPIDPLPPVGEVDRAVERSLATASMDR